MQPREHLSIHLLQHGFAVQWIRTGPVVAEVHVKLAAPRCVIRTSLTVVLFQADLRCDMRIIDWPNYSLFNHFDVCGNHCSPFVLRWLGSNFVTPAPRFTRLRSVLGGSFAIW